MVRFGLNIKDLLFTWYLGKTRSKLSKNILHPQNYALPYTYACHYKSRKSLRSYHATKVYNWNFQSRHYV